MTERATEWIKDKEHCWICRRTREEVYADSYPHGDIFDDGLDGGKLANVFVKEGIEIICEKFPICQICQYILEDVAERSTEQYLKDLVKI